MPDMAFGRTATPPGYAEGATYTRSPQPQKQTLGASSHLVLTILKIIRRPDTSQRHIGQSKLFKRRKCVQVPGAKGIPAHMHRRGMPRASLSPDFVDSPVGKRRTRHTST